MKDATETTTIENQNLPATTSDNLPTTQPAQIETIEFSQTGMEELFTAIQYAETQKVEEMSAVRVDATYLEMNKEGESKILMLAGYSWRDSQYEGQGKLPSANLYDIKAQCFHYAMQTALVGKLIEANMPRGQLVRITYLGKEKGKKYQYDNFKIEALVKKAEPEAETKSGKK